MAISAEFWIENTAEGRASNSPLTELSGDIELCPRPSLKGPTCVKGKTNNAQSARYVKVYFTRSKCLFDKLEGNRELLFLYFTTHPLRWF